MIENQRYMWKGKEVSAQHMKDLMQPAFRGKQGRRSGFHDMDDLYVSYRGVFGSFAGNLVLFPEGADPLVWMDENFTAAYGPEMEVER